MPAFAGHRIALLSYHSPRGAQPIPGLPTYLVENIGTSPVRLLRALPTILRAFIVERPNVVVSTGSEIAIPVFYLARLLRCRLIFIESWCRVRTPSGTGKLVQPIVDELFVQWPSLLDVYGPKAEHAGRVR